MTIDEAKKIPVDANGCCVAIKGKRWKDHPYDKFCEIVMRCDKFFLWGDGGNDYAWDSHVRHLVHFPERPSSFLFGDDVINMYYGREHFRTEERYIRYLNCQKTVQNDYERRRTEWHKHWRTIEFDYNVLATDVISTAYVCGPQSWFHPNGIIDGWNWFEIDEIGDAYPDLEMFNKAFPELEFDVSFADSDGKVYVTFHLGQSGIHIVYGPDKIKIKERKHHKFWKRYSNNHSSLDDIKFALLKPFVSKEWLDANIKIRRAFWVRSYLTEQFFTDIELREAIKYYNEILRNEE